MRIMEQPDITSLPQNLEAEQALLGAILANNKAFEKVSEFLKPQHFADSMHAKIFEVISKLITRGHVADVITLKNYFEQEGSLDLTLSTTLPAKIWTPTPMNKSNRRKSVFLNCQTKATSTAALWTFHKP